VLIGDSFSRGIRSPRLFREWSARYYREAIRRLHAAGKLVAGHVDARLRGALAMMQEVGADSCDAVTPRVVNGRDLAARGCRGGAGPDLMVSRGPVPALWLAGSPLELFRGAPRDWLQLRRESPRLIAAAWDRVPPGAEEQWIFRRRSGKHLWMSGAANDVFRAEVLG
jgi:hypothetical protein